MKHLFASVLACVVLASSAFSQTLYDLTKVKYVSSSIVVAVGNSGAILRSTNAGANWLPVASPTVYALRGLAFADANNGLAVGGGNFTGTGTVIKTTDGGATWSVKNSFLPNTFRAVAFPTANAACAVGLGGLIERSTDGGTTWVLEPSGTTTDLNGVAFSDSSTGWAVGYAGIFKTTNGGTTWVQETSASGEQQMGDAFVSSSVGFSIGAYGEVQKTANGGSSWTLQTEGIAAYNNDVAFFDANNGYIVAAGGIVVHTSNGGTNWTTQTSNAGGNYLGGVATLNDSTAIAVGGANTIIKTTTKGVTWTKQTVGAGSSAPLAPVLVSPANGATGQPTSLTLSWLSSAGATSYIVQVDSSSTFGSLTLNDSSVTTTSRVVNGLVSNTTYNWRVAATNSVGTSAFSTANTFTTTSGGSTSGPILSVSPTSLSYDTTRLGTTKFKNVTVSNPGGGTLTISSISSSNPSVFFSNTPTPINVNGGSSTTVSIGFHPATKDRAGHPETGSVTFNSNGQPSSAVVSCSGRGYALSKH